MNRWIGSMIWYIRALVSVADAVGGLVEAGRGCSEWGLIWQSNLDGC